MAETPETVEVNVVMGAQTRAIVRSALIHVKNQITEKLLDDAPTLAIQEIDAELSKWPLAIEPDQPDTLPQWLYNRFGRYMTDGISPTPSWEDLEMDTQVYWVHQAAAVRRAVGRGGFKTAHRDRMNMVLSTPINDLHQAAKEAHEGGGAIKSLRPLDLKHTEELGEAIRIAVGAASTCWTNLIGAGVFKSEECLDIAEQLEHHFHMLMVLQNAQMGERHQTLHDHLQKYQQEGTPMVSISQVIAILTGRATPAEYESALQVRPDHG